MCRPCLQSILWKELEQNNNECKITDIKDKHVAEFSYKLLNNILCNNVYLS